VGDVLCLIDDDDVVGVVHGVVEDFLANGFDGVFAEIRSVAFPGNSALFRKKVKVFRSSPAFRGVPPGRPLTIKI
jgi:hypothetical protein